jgi:hypothetical protein
MQFSRQCMIVYVTRVRGVRGSGLFESHIDIFQHSIIYVH